MSDDQDWRLQARLEPAAHRGALERLLGAATEHGRLAGDARAAIGSDVAVTNDGDLLFAYANSRAAIDTARREIEATLTHDGAEAAITVSHWDPTIDEWRQVEPPLTGEDAERERTEIVNEEKVETQTVVASAGKLVQAGIESSMREAAERLGLRCEIVEHPHLLTTQVAFTVTGPRRRIEEFRHTLDTEAWQTIRADGFGTGLI